VGAYEKWLGKHEIKKSSDYDTRAAFDAGVTPDARGHLPDTYKLPNHITYSDESIYSQKKDAPPPGKWVGDDNKGWEFRATQTNIDNAGGVDKLQDYFKREEPDAKLVLPNSNAKGGAITIDDGNPAKRRKLI
jgi:hypothetical protein